MSIPPDSRPPASRDDGRPGRPHTPASDQPAAKPVPNPAADALHSDPHANARDADRVLGGDPAKRREVERAQANKHAAEKERESDSLGAVADIATSMTSRD